MTFRDSSISSPRMTSASRGDRTCEHDEAPENRTIPGADVGPVRRNSNKSVLLPPSLLELRKLAGLAPKLVASDSPSERPPRLLRRRLNPAFVTEIAEKYRAGATTPSLCAEYTVSKGGLLKLLRDEGVQLRCQPLTDDQVREATALYGSGKSIAAIAMHFDVSCNGVRQAFVRAGVERRPRGGRRA